MERYCHGRGNHRFRSHSACWFFHCMAPARGVKKATQLENFITLSQELESADFMAATEAVLQLRPNPQTGHLGAKSEAELRQVGRVLNYFERIGILVHKKYLSESLAVDWFGAVARDMYDVVGPWIEAAQITNPYRCSEFAGFVRTIDRHWNKIGRRPLGPLA